MGSISYPQDLLDELASHTRPKQYGDDQEVQQHLNLGHALVAVPQRPVNVVVSLRADGLMHRQTGLCAVNHYAPQVRLYGR